MYRLIDVFLSLVGLICFTPILLFICLIGLFDTGSPIFLQKRMGKDQRTFTLVKLRTMSKDTKSVASHLASQSSITRLGRVLRKTKLDELPQLLNVLNGDMSLVGPRPNLENQFELITERENLNIYAVRPGITGKAQIQNIDMSTPKRLASIDAEMIASMSLRNYFLYIFKTVLGAGAGDAADSK